ncbi:DGAT1/2-independent enzyme synthesizing storage lipids-like [Dermatophagoides pteronyssinus]|uniref:DGAT1/2-independent enzyme synthesizing storage lipids-like n=1 Tax=Dermatophagoides pteronyssinus TaxID=6956 RepID=UPI003F6680CA
MIMAIDCSQRAIIAQAYKLPSIFILIISFSYISSEQLYWMLIYMIIFTFIPNALHSLFVIFIATSDRLTERIKSINNDDDNDNDKKQTIWQKYRHSLLTKQLYLFNCLANFISNLIDLYAWLAHSYEIIGIENIPNDPNCAALMICYHGILPTDMIFVYNKIYKKYHRFPRAVGDRFLFIFGNLIRDYIFPGPASKCIETLKQGHLLVIAPGGTREAQFATTQYETLWNNRCGFARVAKEAKVDIIPIFTKNSRQIYIIPRIFQILLKPLYELTRIPVVPFFGGFPVKLTSFIGKPIHYDSVDSPEELARICQKTIDDMIVKYQTFPATIIGAIKERFIKCDNHLSKTSISSTETSKNE